MCFWFRAFEEGQCVTERDLSMCYVNVLHVVVDAALARTLFSISVQAIANAVWRGAPTCQVSDEVAATEIWTPQETPRRGVA